MIEPQSTDRIPSRVVVGYGAGEFGVAAVEFFLRVYLIVYAVEVLRLPSALAGVLLGVAVVWDAVTDPLMGEISDQTRSGWGRRRIWIGVGGIVTAVAFSALFATPALGESVSVRGAQLLGLYLVCNTALTVLAVPHSALGGELSGVPEERNRIFGWRFLFANLGLLAAVVAPAVIPGGGRSGGLASIPISAALAVSTLVCLWATRGRDRPGSGRPTAPLAHLLRSVARALRPGPFLPLVAAFLVGSVGLTLNSSFALFFYIHRLQLSEKQVLLGILLPFSAVIALSILGWVQVAKRLGRKRTAFVGVFGLGLGTVVVYPLMPPGELLWPVAWGVVGGVLVGAVFLLDATVADVVDWDEAVTGEHREGVYFGLWRMTAKFARAVGLGLTGVVLDLIGFVPGAEVHSDASRWGLAMAFGPGVGGLLVVAALVWLMVPLDEATQRRIGRILAWRAARGSAR